MGREDHQNYMKKSKEQNFNKGIHTSGRPPVSADLKRHYAEAPASRTAEDLQLPSEPLLPLGAPAVAVLRALMKPHHQTGMMQEAHPGPGASNPTPDSCQGGAALPGPPHCSARAVLLQQG